jgi:hypothetical protein
MEPAASVRTLKETLSMEVEPTVSFWKKKQRSVAASTIIQSVSAAITASMSRASITIQLSRITIFPQKAMPQSTLLHTAITC